jgi:hypothetical protein
MPCTVHANMCRDVRTTWRDVAGQRVADGTLRAVCTGFMCCSPAAAPYLINPPRLSGTRCIQGSPHEDAALTGRMAHRVIRMSTKNSNTRLCGTGARDGLQHGRSWLPAQRGRGRARCGVVPHALSIMLPTAATTGAAMASAFAGATRLPARAHSEGGGPWD